jgi:membrane-associated phospholipid phosphatase
MVMSVATPETPSTRPALWREPAPQHFDTRVPLWIKLGVIIVAAVVSIQWIDQPLAVFAWQNPIPDMARLAPGARTFGDVGRDLMFLEQWGGPTCSVLAVVAVAVLDRAGRRRGLAIAIACLATMVITHLLKDIVGRSRPFALPDSLDGRWVWGGPAMGFGGSSKWAAFPSAHTSAAFALSAALAWFYPRGRILFMTLATITAGQRVLHCAHYLSDVIAGLAVGVYTARATLHWGAAGRYIALLPQWGQRWYRDRW